MVLELSEETEKLLSQASEWERKKAMIMAERAIRQAFGIDEDIFYEENKKKLFEVMDEISRKAKERGLTEKILQEILNSDDE